MDTEILPRLINARSTKANTKIVILLRLWHESNHTKDSLWESKLLDQTHAPVLSWKLFRLRYVYMGRAYEKYSLRYVKYVTPYFTIYFFANGSGA